MLLLLVNSVSKEVRVSEPGSQSQRHGGVRERGRSKEVIVSESGSKTWWSQRIGSWQDGQTQRHEVRVKDAIKSENTSQSKNQGVRESEIRSKTSRVRVNSKYLSSLCYLKCFLFVYVFHTIKLTSSELFKQVTRCLRCSH